MNCTTTFCIVKLQSFIVVVKSSPAKEEQEDEVFVVIRGGVCKV